MSMDETLGTMPQVEIPDEKDERFCVLSFEQVSIVQKFFARKIYTVASGKLFHPSLIFLMPSVKLRTIRQ